MNSNLIIIALLQFTLFCTPLVWQAAALDLEESPDQQWICRELCPSSIKQKDSLPVKNQRMEPPQDRMLNSTKLQQGDLLQELLAPEAEVVSHVSMQQGGKEGNSQNNSHDSDWQENSFLKEFTAEKTMP